MAYAALVSLAQTTDQILYGHQYPIFLHAEQQIRYLHDQLIFLQAFLEDFPDKADHNLEGRIKDVAYEAEDAIEYFISEQISSYHHLGTLATSSEFLNYQRVMLDRELRRVTEEIDSHVAEVLDIKSDLKVKAVQLCDSPGATSSSRAVSVSKDVMIGFEGDLMTIKTRLCEDDSKLRVIPIFGMGGVGNTTLAKNVYNDPLTVEHFHILAWVTVSQDYSAREIFSSLLVSMKACTANQCEWSDDLLAEHAYKCLKGKRYLVVMDDIWSTKSWEDVKRIFPDDDNGSRIILTTRLLDVATYAGFSSLHKMRFMDGDQSWNLLKEKVFKEEGCPAELESIGKMIARNCGGLPLVIVVIAGLLSTISITQASWQHIAENINLFDTTIEEHLVLKTLSLSYIHLPHHLRPCFLYMGSLPIGYVGKVSKLIKLWVAEGFVKPSRSKSFEEVAEEYVEELVKRSLILVVTMKQNGKIKTCRIHDLLRNFCRRKSHEENFLRHVSGRYVHIILPRGTKNHRRLIISSEISCLTNICGPTIRTIILFPTPKFDKFFKKF